MTVNVKIYRHLVFIWLILAAMPSYLLMSNQQIFPWLDLSQPLAQILFWLTSTGTAPYGAMTVVVFLAICMKFVPKPLWVRLTCAVILSLSISTTLNHQLKSYFTEPRPNATFLSEQAQSQLDLDSFYQQKKKQRRKIIEKTIEQYQSPENTEQLHTVPALAISSMIQKHWIHEVGYAFPSGHTIFAVTLVLTSSFYLLLAGATGVNIALVFWGLMMGVSRMLLGMHWPQDVFASTCIAVFISIFSVYLVEIINKKYIITMSIKSRH